MDFFREVHPGPEMASQNDQTRHDSHGELRAGGAMPTRG